MMDSITHIVNILSLVELVGATILHSVGLYLLLTARERKIMALLMAHLSLIELSCSLFQGVEAMYYYITGFYIIELKIILTILIAQFTLQFLTLVAITLERVLTILMQARR